MGASLLAVMEDDTGAAREQYAGLKASSGIIGFGISVDRILGLLAGNTGNLDGAVIHFRDTEAFCRKASYRPELAWTCHDHAATLLKFGGPGNLEVAASLLEEGLSITTELGMAPLFGKMTALQEKLASAVPTIPAYPGGLTPREVEVLRLISDGKSNREIANDLVLSERTVQRHIYNIYNKINVRNRAEATTFALSQLPF